TSTNAGLFTLGAITGSASSGVQSITFAANNVGNIAASGVISDGSGGGKVAVTLGGTGPGVVTLSGANTYTGGTTITSGTLSFLTTASLPGYAASPATALGSLSVASGARLSLGFGSAGQFTA